MIKFLLLATATLSCTTAVAAQDRLAATVAGTAPVKPKLICRSTTVTGSLVQQARRCGTAEEWARSNDNQRKFARNVVSAHASGTTSN